MPGQSDGMEASPANLRISTEAMISRFKAATNLGAIAMQLELESQLIRGSIADIVPERFDMPEGLEVMVEPHGHEDTMNAEWLSEGGSNEESKWQSSSPGGRNSEQYKEYVIAKPYRQTFYAQSLCYDRKQSELWAYSADEKFRVRIRDDVTMRTVEHPQT
jgi:hypothetical protein